MNDDVFDTTFQSTSKKLDLNSQLKQIRDEHSGKNILSEKFSTNELTEILAVMEGELQARDDAIQYLKRERNNILLTDAKYGNDPFFALCRDSIITEEVINKDQIENMYGSQVHSLENLISIQKKSQKNAAMLLSSLDKKHSKLIKKLEADRREKIEYAKQGDDLVAMLEKERTNLSQQIQSHIEEKNKFREEKDALVMKMTTEKKRHEAIVLYLIHERKHLLLKMHELRVNAEQLLKQQQEKPSSSGQPSDRELIEVLKKELDVIRDERSRLLEDQKRLQIENTNLRRTIKGQESDLNFLKKNLTIKNENNKPSTMLPQLAPDGALVVANRGATAARGSSQPGANNRSMEKSRLPRAPLNGIASTVPRTSFGGSPAVTRTLGSPVKKTPVMGVSSSNVRRPSTAVPMLNNKNNSSSASAVVLTPEIEQLEAAIQSMNVTNPTTSAIKRSSSLPRDKRSSNINNNNNKISTSVKGSTSAHVNISSTATVNTSKIASPSTVRANERKLSGNVKRNGILSKAFGGTGKPQA